MARVSIIPVKIPLSSGIKVPDFVAQTSTADGAKIDFSEMDSRIVVLVQNSNAATQTVTFEKGDGIQGVSDEVFSLPAGTMFAFNLESGRFKKTSGESKGFVVAKGSTNDVKFAAVVTN